MVIDFLKKYQEELILQRIDLKEDIDLLQIKINEESKFLSMLEDTNDTYFNVFTPRPLNEKNNVKAEEVRSSLNELQSKLGKMSDDMKFYDSRISEINTLISSCSKESIVPSVTPENMDSQKLVNKQFLDKLLLVKSYIFQDPQRANLELEALIDQYK